MDELTVQKLAATLSALPAEAVLSLDYDSNKFDVHLGEEWLGGICISGEEAGQFYTAESVWSKLRPTIRLGGRHPDVLKDRREMLQMQVETIEALDSMRSARRKQAIRNLEARFDPKTISEFQIYDEVERLGGGICRGSIAR